jgi:hypothetical protein
MAVTITTNNLSGEAPVAVNIAPFDTTAFVEVDSDSPLYDSSTQYRVAGDNPSYPLHIAVGNKKVKIFHPADGETKKYDGRLYEVVVHSDHTVDDSVAGRVGILPLTIRVQIQQAGAVIHNTDDVLQLILSTVSLLWASVGAGVPNEGRLQAISLGQTEIV